MAERILPIKPDKNKIGDVFGRLTIIDTAEPYQPRNKTRWLCRCTCGKVFVVHQSALRTGRTKSCGCLSRGQFVQSNTTHGQCGTQTYWSWQGMKARCQDPHHRQYRNYGGRGITVCERWQGFANFLADMGERPKGRTLDRKDVNGNYEKANCKWSTAKQQHNNRTNNRLVTIRDVTKTLQEWCDYYNVPYSRAASRLKYGWNAERAFTEPVHR